MAGTFLLLHRVRAVDGSLKSTSNRSILLQLDSDKKASQYHYVCFFVVFGDAGYRDCRLLVCRLEFCNGHIMGVTDQSEMP
jgi:hypothetical protein